MLIEELVLESTLPGAALPPRDERRTSDISLDLAGNIFTGRHHYEIFNHRYLVVLSSGRFCKTREYEIGIDSLNPKPRRQLKIAWRSALALLAFSAVSLLAFTTGHVPAAAITGPVSTAFALLALVLAITLTRDQYVFYSRAVRTPLVTFPYRRKDRLLLHGFLKILVACIRRLENSPDFADSNQALNVELREHRRLMEEGIISPRGYARAKKRILELHR